MTYRRATKSRASKGTLYPYPDYHVLWAVEATDNGEPILNRTLSADVPKRIRNSKNVPEIRNNQYSYGCFFTGVECFIGRRDLFWSRDKNPWQATKEHLLSRLHHAKEFKDDWSRTNFVFAGYRINYELGHAPASVKLLLRRELKTVEYDRTDTLNHHGTFDVVFREMLDVKRGFTMHGKLPWHPQSYSMVHQRRAAQDFLDRINQMDRTWFEQLTMENRFEHFDRTELPIELI